MIKIAVFSRKGGVGKSATCINLSGCLDVVYKKRVLIIDCDAQQNSTLCFYPDENSNVRKNIIDLFKDEKVTPEEIIRPVSIDTRGKKGIINTNISLIAGSPELDFDFTDSNRIFALRDFLTTVEDRFDYAFFDCPPSLTNATVIALCSCDYVLIPVESGSACANGYSMVMEEIDQMKENGFNVNIKVLGAFPSRIDKRHVLDDYYKSLWQNNFKSKMFLSSIRQSSDVKNSYEFNMPVNYYKKNSAVSKDYEELANEVISKVNADISKRKRGK